MAARIEIVDYDPRWPGMFEAERTLLLGALGPWLAGPVEHIGSTAVIGLRAKPDREAYTDGKADFVRRMLARVVGE